MVERRSGRRGVTVELPTAIEMGGHVIEVSALNEIPYNTLLTRLRESAGMSSAEVGVAMLRREDVYLRYEKVDKPIVPNVATIKRITKKAYGAGENDSLTQYLILRAEAIRSDRAKETVRRKTQVMQPRQ